MQKQSADQFIASMEQMAERDNSPEPTELPPEALDPFAYFPGVESKIQGLGGTDVRADLAYGFHTHYVHCATGYCTFSVELENFEASYGLIHLRVHMLSTRPGSQAHVTTVERMYMTDLVAQGGRAEIRFESLPGTLYALFAQILDTTDARATGLTVTLDRPGSPADITPPARLEPTVLGHGVTRDIDQLSSADMPSFADPVSQVITASQLKEQAFGVWHAQLSTRSGDIAGVWQQALILQALSRYGMLDQAAHGLGLTVPDMPVSTILAERGCTVSLALDSEHIADNREVRGFLTDPLPGVAGAGSASPQSIHFLPRSAVDSGEIIGPFDFLWTTDMIESFDDLPSVLRFITRTLEHLRPGGLAIHVTKILIDGPVGEERGNWPGFLTRVQIERLSLTLLSLGHNVAQLRFDLGTKPRDKLRIDRSPKAFGWIIRRGA